MLHPRILAVVESGNRASDQTLAILPRLRSYHCRAARESKSRWPDRFRGIFQIKRGARSARKNGVARGFSAPELCRTVESPRLRVASQISSPIVACTSVMLCFNEESNRLDCHRPHGVGRGGPLNQRIEVNPPCEHDAYLVLVVSVSGGVL
jgi:hypothetical protein